VMEDVYMNCFHAKNKNINKIIQTMIISFCNFPIKPLLNIDAFL
jgi:hypothetical protein